MSEGTRELLRLAILLVALQAFVLDHVSAATNARPALRPPTPPLVFEPAGLSSPDGAAFTARPSGGLVLAQADGLLIEARDGQTPAVLLTFAGARRLAWTGREQRTSHSNYYLGRERKDWRERVPHFGSIVAQEAYEGIDLVLRGTDEGGVELVLEVEPGADSNRVRIRCPEGGAFSVDERGNLRISMGGGEVLSLRSPLAAESEPGAGRLLTARYVVSNRNREVRIAVAGRNKQAALTVDPVLVFSTYFGGSAGEGAEAVATDAAGATYLVGVTTSADFPTQGAIQPALRGTSDAFVAKFAPSGQLLFSTFLGGSDADSGLGVAAGNDGPVVVGRTSSTDFPIMSAIQQILGGGGDSFVTKLSNDGGTIIYSTYLGGSLDDMAYGVAVDPSQNAYVTGSTLSSNFPRIVLPGLLAGTDDAFVAKLDRSGASLLYSGYLGGSGVEVGTSIAVGCTGEAVVVGFTTSVDFPLVNPFQSSYGGSGDTFIMRLPATGWPPVYSTYLGGIAGEIAQGVDVDSGGSAVVVGFTGSADFPTRAAFQSAYQGGVRDAYVIKLDPAGVAVFSTYLGGSAEDLGRAAAIDCSGRIYASGMTWSSDFPLVNPVQASNGGSGDGWIATLSSDGSTLEFATYLGGSDYELLTHQSLSVGALGSVYLAGGTSSSDFPIRNAVQATLNGGADPFLTRIDDPAGCSSRTPGSVGNTLKLARGSATVEFRWVDVAAADTYEVYSADTKGAPFVTFVGSAASGPVGLSIVDPSVDLRFYRVAGANCWGSGPIDLRPDFAPPHPTLSPRRSRCLRMRSMTSGS